MNFNVPLPPPYYREMWDYKHANAENIQKAISMFEIQKAFKNKNTYEMTRILTDTLMNFFKNFISHKSKKTDCKHPEWMNSFIISSLEKRTKYTKRFYKNTSDYNKDLIIIKQTNVEGLLSKQKKN